MPRQRIRSSSHTPTFSTSAGVRIQVRLGRVQGHKSTPVRLGGVQVHRRAPVHFCAPVRAFTTPIHIINGGGVSASPPPPGILPTELSTVLTKPSTAVPSAVPTVTAHDSDGADGSQCNMLSVISAVLNANGTITLTLAAALKDKTEDKLKVRLFVNGVLQEELPKVSVKGTIVTITPTTKIPATRTITSRVHSQSNTITGTIGTGNCLAPFCVMPACTTVPTVITTTSNGTNTTLTFTGIVTVPAGLQIFEVVSGQALGSPLAQTVSGNTITVVSTATNFLVTGGPGCPANAGVVTVPAPTFCPDLSRFALLQLSPTTATFSNGLNPIPTGLIALPIRSASLSGLVLTSKVAGLNTNSTIDPLNAGIVIPSSGVINGNFANVISFEVVSGPCCYSPILRVPLPMMCAQPKVTSVTVDLSAAPNATITLQSFGPVDAYPISSTGEVSLTAVPFTLVGTAGTVVLLGNSTTTIVGAIIVNDNGGIACDANSGIQFIGVPPCTGSLSDLTETIITSAVGGMSASFGNPTLVLDSAAFTPTSTATLTVSDGSLPPSSVVSLTAYTTTSTSFAVPLQSIGCAQSNILLTLTDGSCVYTQTFTLACPSTLTATNSSVTYDSTLGILTVSATSGAYITSCAQLTMGASTPISPTTFGQTATFAVGASFNTLFTATLINYPGCPSVAYTIGTPALAIAPLVSTLTKSVSKSDAALITGPITFSM